MPSPPPSRVPATTPSASHPTAAAWYASPPSPTLPTAAARLGGCRPLPSPAARATTQRHPTASTTCARALHASVRTTRPSARPPPRHGRGQARHIQLAAGAHRRPPTPAMHARGGVPPPADEERHPPAHPHGTRCRCGDDQETATPLVRAVRDRHPRACRSATVGLRPPDVQSVAIVRLNFVETVSPRIVTRSRLLIGLNGRSTADTCVNRTVNVGQPILVIKGHRAQDRMRLQRRQTVRGEVARRETTRRQRQRRRQRRRRW